LKARIAFRVLIGIGLFLAWVGLTLPWQSWGSSSDDFIKGFEESRPFWIVLAGATLLAAIAVFRHYRWAFAALAVAALGLVVIAVREIDENLEASSPFVTVDAGAGLIMSLIGAAALLAAVVVALAPRAVVLAGGAAAVALATTLAAVLPHEDGRPPGGAIADHFEDGALAMTFAGDAPYRLGGTNVYADPAPDREYYALDVWDGFEWSPDDPEFDTFSAHSIAYGGGAMFVALAGIDRLVAHTPDGEGRMLVARPPDRERKDPPIPDGLQTQLVDDFVAGPLAATPDGAVFVLMGNQIARWRNGRLHVLAGSSRSGFAGDGGPAIRAQFDGPRAIATDPRGVLYVADTGNGRVRRIDPAGTIETVVGTEAGPHCVRRGGDEPLALDVRRCLGVKALAVDGDGNLYLALRGVARIVGVTREGEMAVVAGTGALGWGDGDGDATGARLGDVDALTVGPDGDLYVTESEPIDRVRRIADPASLLEDSSEPSEPAGTAPACGEIAALMEATVDLRDPEALERSLNDLANVVPEAIRDDVDEFAGGIASREDAIALIGFAMAPGEDDVSMGDYAEEECGLIAGFDVPLDEALRYCIAYQRYIDQGEVARAGEDVPDALPDVVDAAPPFVAPAGRAALRELDRAAGRAVPDSEAADVIAGAEALNTVASSMCALS
jgi:sugar lactone lactonase YvrE